MNLENYIISYTNPIVLIKYCKFVVRYGTSLLDSRVFDQGKYLIRYFYPELAMDMKEELNYNKDLGHKNNFIDITDEETLTSTIKETLKDSKYRAVSNNLVNDEKDSINRIIKYFNSKKKFIYVFLNNKIISCDTILPIMLEVKTNNKNIDIIFWSFDFNTYEFIKKNELLYKAIKEIGSLVCLGRKKNSLYFSNKGVSKYSYKRLNIIINCLKNLNNFISLFKNILINKVIFIHFRALNLWPTRLIYYLNKKNTILCDADSSGWSLSGYKADKSVHEQRPDPYAFKNLSPRGKKVIAFSKDWPLLKHPAIINAKKYIIESSHKRKVWIDYLKNNASSMIKQSTGLNQQQKFCVLLLGHIGEEASGAKFLKNKDSWTTLVEDILDIIYDEWPEITILVKPHIITDMQCLEKIIAARKHIKIKITYLHPGLLAIFSKFSVATYYSTVFQSISCLGGITVEYTDQKLEYLKNLSFKSKRPEFTNYFFNNDENGFRDFLIKFKLGSIKVNLSEGSTEDPSNIINFLSN